MAARAGVQPKRRSTLAELGIRPAGSTGSPAPAPSPIANKGGSPAPEPSAAVTRRGSVAGGNRPRPLSMIASSTSNNIGRTSSPPTPQPTTAASKRRSLVFPSSPANSTLDRRSSTASKRMSLPPTPSPSSSSHFAQQLKDLQKKLEEKEHLLEEKERIILELQASCSEKSSDPDTPLLSSSSTLIPCDPIIEVDKLRDEYEQEIEQVRKRLQEAEIEKAKENASLEEHVRTRVRLEMTALHQKALDELMDNHESQLGSLRSEHIHQMDRLRLDHSNQLEKLKLEYDEQLVDARLAQENLRDEVEKLKAELTTVDAEKRVLEERLDTSRNMSNIRRLEMQLTQSQAAFDEYKRQAEQTTEALERRFRAEMQQLQSSSDDSARDWLEKHRAMQNEIDRLEALNQTLERTHAQALVALENNHQDEIEEWKERIEAQEDEMDHQAQQIQTLLSQIEDLQNSLEAATRRLEERAHSPAAAAVSSSRKVSLEEPLREQQRVWEERLQTKQAEIDEVHRRMAELKDAHECQLNRLGHEKARELQELQSEIKQLHQMLQQAQALGEERYKLLAEQHKKEIHLMHAQYQKLVDLKDRELEDYAYRVKVVATTKQEELTRKSTESSGQITHLEREIEGYETRIRQYERRTKDLETQCAACRDENEQLSKLIQQLQGEIR
ncbi:hypothetical protein BX666DRAFT_1919004 [Dichotomocladium elegans]|nr:hypothetical protein BX666DRAFT_1919004 [Dichotomocladium elegans]